MTLPIAASLAHSDPYFRTRMAYPAPIVALEAFLRTVTGADADQVAEGMGLDRAYAGRLLRTAYAMGLIARVDLGWYSVHVRQAREARIQ